MSGEFNRTKTLKKKKKNTEEKIKKQYSLGFSLCTRVFNNTKILVLFPARGAKDIFEKLQKPAAISLY